ncbi:MAG: hypothetical protein ACEQSF_00950 [Solirubrobacteraceae bacterium]
MKKILLFLISFVVFNSCGMEDEQVSLIKSLPGGTSQSVSRSGDELILGKVYYSPAGVVHHNRSLNSLPMINPLLDPPQRNDVNTINFNSFAGEFNITNGSVPIIRFLVRDLGIATQETITNLNYRTIFRYQNISGEERLFTRDNQVRFRQSTVQNNFIDFLLFTNEAQNYFDVNNTMYGFLNYIHQLYGEFIDDGQEFRLVAVYIDLLPGTNYGIPTVSGSPPGIDYPQDEISAQLYSNDDQETGDSSYSNPSGANNVSDLSWRQSDGGLRRILAPSLAPTVTLENVRWFKLGTLSSYFTLNIKAGSNFTSQYVKVKFLVHYNFYPLRSLNLKSAPYSKRITVPGFVFFKVANGTNNPIRRILIPRAMTGKGYSTMVVNGLRRPVFFKSVSVVLQNSNNRIFGHYITNPDNLVRSDGSLIFDKYKD